MEDFVGPKSRKPLRRDCDYLVNDSGARFPIIAGVPRFCEIENYTARFGRQWKQFQTTRIDGEVISSNPSATRLFAETGWSPKKLAGIDCSTAIEVNWANNARIGKGRFVPCPSQHL